MDEIADCLAAKRYLKVIRSMQLSLIAVLAHPPSLGHCSLLLSRSKWPLNQKFYANILCCKLNSLLGLLRLLEQLPNVQRIKVTSNVVSVSM